jgi:protein SCO1
MPRMVWPLVASVLLLACGRPAPMFHAEDITGSALGTNFRLQDGAGRARELAEFNGKVVVVFFGYTRCPDVCPTTLAGLAEARRLLGSDGGPRVQVIFVTLDPDRDTPQSLAAFVTWFDPTFLGLWGNSETTEATAKAFKVAYGKHVSDSVMGYSIDHFAGGFAYDPAGRLRLLIPQGEPPAQIAEDLAQLLAGK